MRRTKSHSNLLVSDQTCTVIIIAALCLWLGAVLIFLSFNSNDSNTSFANQWNPFSKVITASKIDTKPNIKSVSTAKASNTQSQSSSSPRLSYWESISPELTSSGWKSIYIHNRNVRMPVEEMEYLMEKYWYPHIKDLDPSISNNDNPSPKEIDVFEPNLEEPQPPAIISNDEEEEEGIQDIDFEILRKSKKKKKKRKRHKMDKDQGEVSNQQKNTDPKIKYPSNWNNPCSSTKAYDIDCISSNMKYWTNGVAKTSVNAPVDIKTKYVTFLKDCGGFNNIRQGFEFHAMIAWLTDRTLVLPPDIGWYLIDWGGMKRGIEGKSQHNQLAWPNDAPRSDGVSNYDIWFDLDDMNRKISVITASEFIKREFDNLEMPHKFHGGDVVNQDPNIGKEFTKWLTTKATDMSSLLPWAQLSNYVAWPDKEKVKENGMIDDAWIDHRTVREYTSHLQQAPFIHFPSCQKGLPGDAEPMTNYRYLGQIARSVAFDNMEDDRKFKQVLRDFVHLRPEIMEYAAKVVSILGAFKYSSLHIRRNELQYKYVWCEGEKSYNDVKPLIGDTEILYIATDETAPGFFDIFNENGKRQVYQWKDFFGQEAKFEETKDIVVPGKLHGEVEMAICAMGRMFFGTKESTFSSYIGRLRGYFNAPYTQILYHHYQLEEDVDKSSDTSRFSDWGKPYRGQIYKIPFKDLWEDISDLP